MELDKVRVEMEVKLEEKMAGEFELKTSEVKKEINTRLAAIEEENKKLKMSVDVLRDPPVAFACGWKDKFQHVSSMTVTYDSLYYKRTNQWTEEGGLDITTGIYTTPYPGTYTVTYSLMSWVHYGNHIGIHLRKNGAEILESFHRSDFNGASGYVQDQGGRSLVTHLARG